MTDPIPPELLSLLESEGASLSPWQQLLAKSLPLEEQPHCGPGGSVRDVEAYISQLKKDAPHWAYALGGGDYSQYNQQQYLSKFFKDRKGFLIDVGANDGIFLSNSRYLLEHGWSGILVEPHPVAFRELALNTVGHVNATPLNVAFGDKAGTVRLYMPPEEDKDPRGTTATLIPQDGWEHKDVFVHRLGDLFPFAFDLLLIDCEGADFAVLNGVDWEVNRPEMVVFEVVGSGGVNDALKMDAFMRSKGYRLNFIGVIDLFYVRQ